MLWIKALKNGYRKNNPTKNGKYFNEFSIGKIRPWKLKFTKTSQ